jgi:trehalose/maltose transport system permease protein
MKEENNQSLLLRVLFYLLVAVILVFNLFPFVYALVSSFRPSNDLFSTDLWPKALGLDHYQAVFKDARFVGSLINSIIVAGSTVLISLALGSICAYALGRLPFRFKAPVLYLVLTMTMFPSISVLSGLFVMLKALSLFNTRQGLVVTYLIFTMPFTIWVMTQYFRSLPKELEEAAYVDGASPLTVFWQILLPLTMPGLMGLNHGGIHGGDNSAGDPGYDLPVPDCGRPHGRCCERLAYYRSQTSKPRDL